MKIKANIIKNVPNLQKVIKMVNCELLTKKLTNLQFFPSTLAMYLLDRRIDVLVPVSRRLLGAGFLWPDALPDANQIINIWK